MTNERSRDVRNRFLSRFVVGSVFEKKLGFVRNEFGSIRFLSSVSTLTRDIDIAILSVCLSVRPSVHDVPVSDENGLIYRNSSFHHTVAQSF